MDKYIGKRLDGRYLVDELVGIGGMANVYKATDVSNGRIVAVKILISQVNRYRYKLKGHRIKASDAGKRIEQRLSLIHI